MNPWKLMDPTCPHRFFSQAAQRFSEEKKTDTKIIKEEGETNFWEVCASCLDNIGKVKRPYKIKIKYLDVNFNEKEA